MKPLIAVSGKNGQLGWELQRLSERYTNYRFIFCDRNELDITNEEQVGIFFNKYHPQYFINTAAYTAVDKAETDQVGAYKANTEALGILATQCRLHDAVFISFSTDYVFNGAGTTPYQEDQLTEPVNYYGYTKEAGEKLALTSCEKSIIIRTSWVYSSHGHNFVKTMLRLMGDRTDINVVNDQVGSPTYAADLATAVMQMIEAGANHYGIYHFSNEGEISWFDFATAIGLQAGLDCKVHPITTEQFPTPAKRPAYSVLSKNRIVADYPVTLAPWKDGLQRCMQQILEQKGAV